MSLCQAIVDTVSDRAEGRTVTRVEVRIGGHGTHVCLGAAVARLEAKVALEEFLARFPEYEVDESGIDSMHCGNVQGPTRVPLPVG